MLSFSDTTIKSMLKHLFATGGPRGPHITRFAMYRALKDIFAKYDGENTRTLALSESARLGKLVLGLQKTAYTEANYPEVNILSMPFADPEFDFCISDQVLEHVEGDPFQAFKETARVTKQGGFICHTTVFNYHIHGAPKDFWRYTPEALQLMAVAAGCKIVSVAGWGNQEAWAIIDAGFRFVGIPVDEKHPLFEIATRNDPQWPIVVWIVAQRS